MADTANHRTFVEEVAAEDPPVVLRDDSEEPRMAISPDTAPTAISTDGKSGGKLWALAMAANAS